MDQLAFITGTLLPALWGGLVVTLGLIAATAPFWYSRNCATGPAIASTRGASRLVFSSIPSLRR